MKRSPEAQVEHAMLHGIFGGAGAAFATMTLPRDSVPLLFPIVLIPLCALYFGVRAWKEEEKE